MTRRSDTEFRSVIPQSDIHADAMRRLHANPAVTQEAPTMTTHTPPEAAYALDGEFIVNADGYTVACAIHDGGRGTVSEDSKVRFVALLATANAAPTLLADNARLRDALTELVAWFDPAETEQCVTRARATLAATKPHA